MWYAYVSPTVRRPYVVAERFVRAGLLASDGVTGFRSVYFYSESTIQRIIERRHFRNLGTEAVRSEELLLDFDSKPNAAHTLASQLANDGISFRLFTSGNRSVHLHVDIEPMEGTTVGLAQKQWVKIHAPDADQTIYHNTALYRLPGTWHEKNPGHRKSLVSEYKGTYRLVIDPWIKRPPATIQEVQARVSPKLLSLALKDTVSEGGRRCHVWRIGTICCDLGLDYNEAISNAYNWNNTCAVPPLDLDTIERKVREAYEQRSYGG